MRYASRRWMGTVAVWLGLASPTWADPIIFPEDSAAFVPDESEGTVSFGGQREASVKISDATASVRLGQSASASLSAGETQQAQYVAPPAPLSPIAEGQVNRPTQPVFQEAMTPFDDSVGFAQTRPVNEILWRMGRINGDQYGFNGGYTNFNAFVPLFSSGGNAVTFVNPRISVTDYGFAAANVGVGQRYYSPSRDRVYGGSFWYDYDDGHAKAFNQLGGSFENIGQYYSWRSNFYIPVGNRTALSSFTDGAQTFTGNNISVLRNYLYQNAYQVYDGEFAVPAPILGAYGFDFGVGAYYLNGQTAKDAAGVSARVQGQITENFWMNGLYTYDKVFESNFSLNFEFTMPNGKPRRWFRRPPVSSYLTQSVQRRYRVAAGESRSTSSILGRDINGNVITIVYIDPDATTPGDGTIENPYQSTSLYAADANPDRYQFIFVRRGTDANEAANLNTGITLVNYVPSDPSDPGPPVYGQKLIGDIDLPTSQLPTYEVVFNGVTTTFQLPSESNTGSGDSPVLSNFGGANVVTLTGNGHEVFGLTINGATSALVSTANASGIVTPTTTDGFYIHGNTFQNVINGIVINSDTSVATGLDYDNYGRIVDNVLTGTAGESQQAINVNHTAGDLALLVADNTISNFQDGVNSGGVFVSSDGAGSLINAVGTADVELGILRNTITTSGSGIALSATNGGGFVTDLSDNDVTGSTDTAGNGFSASASNSSVMQLNNFNNNIFNLGAGNGALLSATGGSEVSVLQNMLANQFTGNTLDGMNIVSSGAGSQVVIQGIGDGTASNNNLFNDNGDDGFDASASAGGVIGVVNPIIFNQFNNNGDDGLVARATGGSQISMAIGSSTFGNTFAGNGLLSGNGSGIDVSADGAGSELTIPIFGNVISGNTGTGISYTLNNVTVENLIDIQSNTIINNTSDGILISATNSPITQLQIVGNPDIRGNGGNGINLQIANSDIDTIFIDNNGMGTIVPPTPGLFNIDVAFNGGLTPSQQAIFALAAQRWEQIIQGDLPDVGSIDDVLISASGVAIDGVNGILGQAGPTDLRSDGTFLPYAGVMQFDTADLAALEASGQLQDVILHEMAHVLGFGTIWDLKGLLNGAGTANPTYTGTQATAQYNTIFGTSGTSVPVENTGGPGTADAHWRETTFDNELMTGFLNPGVDNPISKVTVGQWADLGYVVDLNQADPYTPPAPIIGPSPVTGPLVQLGTVNQTTPVVSNNTTLSSLVNNIQANGLNGININLNGSSVTNTIISRNIINDHANGDGIRIAATALSNITNLDINNNQIDNNQFHGIELIASGGSTLPAVGNGVIENNIITNQVTGDGVRIVNPDTGGVAFGMDFLNNNISSNAGMGVHVEVNDGAGGITSNFTANSITDNGSFGVSYTGTQAANIVLNVGGPTAEDSNDLSGNGDANLALNLANTSTGALLVQNNTIRNAQNGTNVTFDGEGISLNTTNSASLTSAQILSNVITGNAGDGIELLSNSASTVHASGDPTSGGLLVTGNQIGSNGLNGIDLTRQGNAVVKAIIGTTGGITASADSNMIVNNGSNGISINTSGSTITTSDAVNVIAGQNLIAGNAANGVNVVTGGTSNTRVDLLDNVISGTSGTGGSTQLNGISVTTNDASYFGSSNTGVDSLFDGNIINGNSANGIMFTRANTGSAISEQHVSIFGTLQTSQIYDNGGDGILIRDFSNQQTLGSATVSALMEINIGNPATNSGGQGADVYPDRPDVAIYHNTRDAVEIIQNGSEVLSVNINNLLAMGGQDNGTTSRFGLSFNSDQSIVNGADTILTVNGSTFTGFGDDGMNFFFNTFAPNVGFTGENTSVGGTLSVFVQNSIIGQNEFSFNSGDGVDIEVQDNGANFVFNNNLIQNNEGDGFRMSLHAERLTSGINGSSNRPQVVPDRDSVPDATFNPDTVTPGNSGLNALSNYEYSNGTGAGAPYADMSFIDVTAGLTLTNNLIRYNGDDGVDLVLGAATSLGRETNTSVVFFNSGAAGVAPAGLTVDPLLTSYGHAVVNFNDMSGNATNGFFTRTQDALGSAVVGVSGPRTTASATPNTQVIQLDPLAHMWLDFESNIGSVLNPTVVGGIYNADPTKTPTPNRPVQTNFNVFFNGTGGTQVWTVAGGGLDALTTSERFQLQWNGVVSSLQDSGANSPSYGYFINGTAIFTQPNSGINP